MYRRIDKGMKKTIATAAVAALSFALLAGCGSKTVEPPVKSPDASSSPSTPPTTAPVTPQEDREAVAKAFTDLYVNLTAESKAFEKTEQQLSYAFLDKMFPKSFAAYDLTSFDTKQHAYLAVYVDGGSSAFIASGSPKVSVRDLYTIKDISKIKIAGDKATFKSTDITSMTVIEPVEEITFNKVDGKWLLGGAKYTDAYFKETGLPADFTME